jgi:peptidoglycan/xylan/chitin deacetylase (PgdA/CDA1 family)
MAPAFLETQIPSFAELPAKTLAVDQPPDCSRVACLALTFDDGPDRDTTPVILSALEAAQVQATFFLIGSRVAPDHDIVQRMYRDHDDIGDHSWTHPDLTKLPPDQIASQIALTQAAISAAGVPAPTFVRPPYGAVNPTVLSSVPLPLVLWNVDPRDWAETDPAKIEATVETQVKPGAIVLMHDSKPATAAAVAAILTNLKTRYHLVTVSELLHITAESQGQYFSLYTHR